MTTPPPSLKPCPFCGGEATMARAGLDWFVHCEKCFCGTDHIDTPEDARDVWNTRASETLEADVAALREALESITSVMGQVWLKDWLPAHQVDAIFTTLERTAR